MPLPQLLVGKVAAITGGLTGIGRVLPQTRLILLTNSMTQAIALEYLRHGAKVAINHLGGANEDPLLESMHNDVLEITGPEETRFLAVAGDISEPATGREFVAKTVSAFGQLNIFVSNAGVCKFAEFLE